MTGSVPVEIVTRIAAREGVDPLELEPSLYDVIDADALDTLVQEAAGRPKQVGVRVNFGYCGYLVTVTGTQDVTIEKCGTETEKEETSGGSGRAD